MTADELLAATAAAKAEAEAAAKEELQREREATAAATAEAAAVKDALAAASAKMLAMQAELDVGCCIRAGGLWACLDLSAPYASGMESGDPDK